MNTEKAKCGFGQAWRNPCSFDKPCSLHGHLMCCSCGSPATHECDQTGQFVCGFPLCDDCEHIIVEDGTNGGVGFNEVPIEVLSNKPFLHPAHWTRKSYEKRHVRKIDQKHTPWYTREEGTPNDATTKDHLPQDTPGDQ